jgi:iron-sulfur cluster repair protein YtfE (RIC family)
MADQCGCACKNSPRAAALPSTLGAKDTVADASRRPEALDALKRLGVNHCCGAHLTLAEAAAAAGVPLDELLAAVNAAPLAPASTA